MYIMSVSESCAVSNAAWKWRSALEHPFPDQQNWVSFNILCSLSDNNIAMVVGESLPELFRQPSRHSGLRSFAVGIPESILGLRHSHFHFHFQ